MQCEDLPKVVSCSATSIGLNLILACPIGEVSRKRLTSPFFIRLDNRVFIEGHIYGFVRIESID